MPAARATRLPSGRATDTSLTPLTDADPDLNGLSSLTNKKRVNDARIRDILVILAGDAPQNIRPHHMGHPVTQPRLNVGGTRQMDAGRWFTMCVPLNKTAGCHVKHITPALSPDIILDSEPLSIYLSIRQEILDALKVNKQRRLQDVSDQSHRLSVRTARATSRALSAVPPDVQLPAQRTTSSNGSVLDLSKPVNIMGWLQDGKAPIQVLGYPRMTSRLHLEDHKLALGTHSLEEGMCLEYYDPDAGSWINIRWDSPLLIEKSGAALLVRVQGVKDLMDWDVHVRVALGAGKARCSKRKGQGRSLRL